MRKLALCLVVVAAATACKKSVEGESKRWERANKTVDELRALYPGFKGALDEQRVKAKAAMDEAEQESDDKKRITRMDAANDLITGGFVAQLSAVAEAQKRVQTKLIDLAGKTTDDADRAMAAQATEEAKRIMASAEATLRRGAATAGEATAIAGKVTRDLKTAEDHLDRVAKSAQSKVEAKAEVDKAAADQAAADKAEADKAAAPWTCDHCDTVNEPGATTCSNCGAPRPHDH